MDYSVTEELLYGALAELILANHRFIDLASVSLSSEPRSECEKAFSDLCFATGMAVRNFRRATPNGYDMSANELNLYMRVLVAPGDIPDSSAEGA